jgi:hypothetical protein
VVVEEDVFKKKKNNKKVCVGVLVCVVSPAPIHMHIFKNGLRIRSIFFPHQFSSYSYSLPGKYYNIYQRVNISEYRAAQLLKEPRTIRRKVWTERRHWA